MRSCHGHGDTRIPNLSFLTHWTKNTPFEDFPSLKRWEIREMKPSDGQQALLTKCVSQSKLICQGRISSFSCSHSTGVQYNRLLLAFIRLQCDQLEEQGTSLFHEMTQGPKFFPCFNAATFNPSAPKPQWKIRKLRKRK